MSKKVSIINSDRVALAEVVPLSAPFTVNIFPSTYCDFQCAYCFQSADPATLEKLIGRRMHMSFDTFKKVADSLVAFDKKIKCILFGGYGEPLLNPDLPKMIAYATSLQVSERIELVTNAHTLTPQKSDELIQAGLTALRVSLQGLSAEKYKEISHVNIDFDRFVEQIRYFYNRKQGHNCSVYVKIADVALADGEESQFYEMFDPISDTMAVEHIVEFFEGVDYSVFHKPLSTTKADVGIERLEVCPYPFYSICVSADGTVSNCYTTDFSALGNVKDIGIYEAWNSPQTKAFWLKLLKKQKECAGCQLALGHVKEGDIIDHKAADIALRIQESIQKDGTV